MQPTAPTPHTPPLPSLAPWSLRAWPRLLWQAGAPPRRPFQHLGTRVARSGCSHMACAGQTLWAVHVDEGDAGMAWDWIQIAEGVVAIADPMSVVTNLQLVGQAGEVLTAQEAACFLNQLVRTLPWQHEVRRALDDEGG